MENLILLHGALGAEVELKEIKNLLSGKFNVFTLEFDGHGNHPSSVGITIDYLTEQFQQFISDNNLESFHIFGYSMGGFIALNYASSFDANQPKSIITLGTKFNWDKESTKHEMNLLEPQGMLEKVPKFALYLELLHKDNWRNLCHQTAHLMSQLSQKVDRYYENFGTLNIPVYLGWGEKDKMVSLEETNSMAERIPQSTVFTLPDTPHPLFMVNEALLCTTIEKFVKD